MSSYRKRQSLRTPQRKRETPSQRLESKFDPFVPQDDDVYKAVLADMHVRASTLPIHRTIPPLRRYGETHDKLFKSMKSIATPLLVKKRLGSDDLATPSKRRRVENTMLEGTINKNESIDEASQALECTINKEETIVSPTKQASVKTDNQQIPQNTRPVLDLRGKARLDARQKAMVQRKSAKSQVTRPSWK